MEKWAGPTTIGPKCWTGDDCDGPRPIGPQRTYPISSRWVSGFKKNKIRMDYGGFNNEVGSDGLKCWGRNSYTVAEPHHGV